MKIKAQTLINDNYLLFLIHLVHRLQNRFQLLDL